MAKLAKLSAAIGLALAAPLAAQASLLFDPDGAGALGTYNIDKLDWLPSSVLADNGTQAVLNFIAGSGDTTFWVYTMAKLGSGLLGNNTAFNLDTLAPANDEITMVIGFREQVTNVVGGFAQFTQISNASSFVKMYYDDGSNTTSNDLTGDGFADGTLILSSTLDVASNGTGFFTSDQTDIQDLDQSGDGDQWAGQQTVTGTGINNNINIDLPPTTVDSAFFKNLPLLTFTTTNVSFNTPFTTVNPSKGYYSGATTTPDLTLAGGQVSVGAVNGSFSSGPDFLFSTDYNSSITAAVPEPASLALLGVGLGLIGSVSARRRNKR